MKSLRVHMLGIGGAGMSGLAAMLLRCGSRVSGRDASASAVTESLRVAGIPIGYGPGLAALPADVNLVVASAAVPEDDPELIAARASGVRILKYAQLLGEVMSQYEGVAVSGTHGKSTTTAWLSFVLRLAGLDPNFVVGASVPQLGGGSGVGDGRHFVAEACEYDRSFLNLHPRHAVILNIEEDHLDCYPDLAAIQEAFAAFASQVNGGLLLVNGDDPRCVALAERRLAGGDLRKVATFGLTAGCTWRAEVRDVSRGRHVASVFRAGELLGTVTIGLPGRHNLMNGLAVAALATECGAKWSSIEQGLAEFRGASRRLELRGIRNDIRVVDDYAHHPTEIRATLAAARAHYAPARLWCVFQPHQHSRTRFLLADFARSFELADHVLVPDIYFVRDSQRDREAVSAADLARLVCERGGAARYVPEFEDIVQILARDLRPGDLVLTMGAGTIWKVADAVLERLSGAVEPLSVTPETPDSVL